jgi:hypothetical protein
MTASVIVPPTANCPAIAESAGNVAARDRWITVEPDGALRLHVAGVTQEALEAAAPPMPRYVSAAEFFPLWTAAERAALFAQPDMLDAAMGVVAEGRANLASPRLAALLDEVIQRSALAGERKAQIIAGTPPA